MERGAPDKWGLHMSEGPQAICYYGAPDEIVGWVCPNEFCLAVYLIQVVGTDAEMMAAFCCDHPCWKCGAKSNQGFVLCLKCRNLAHVRANRMKPVKELFQRERLDGDVTLTAPVGTIGAIGNAKDPSDPEDPK